MIVFLRTGFEIAVRRFCAAAGRRRIGDGPEGFLEYRFPGFEFARSGIHRRFVVGQRDAEGAGQPVPSFASRRYSPGGSSGTRQLQRLAGVCGSFGNAFCARIFPVFYDERQIDTALPARFGAEKFELDLPRRMIQCPVEVEVEGSERAVFGFDLLVAQGFFIELHFVDGSEECVSGAPKASEPIDTLRSLRRRRPEPVPCSVRTGSGSRSDRSQHQLRRFQTAVIWTQSFFVMFPRIAWLRPI